MMLKCMCQLDWAKGHPGSSQNMIFGHICDCFQERVVFELVDQAKNTILPAEGLTGTKRQRKGKFALCLS